MSSELRKIKYKNRQGIPEFISEKDEFVRVMVNSPIRKVFKIEVREIRDFYNEMMEGGEAYS